MRKDVTNGFVEGKISFLQVYTKKGYHKKISNISLAEKKSQPIMLKTGASANAPVFLCPKVEA